MSQYKDKQMEHEISLSHMSSDQKSKEDGNLFYFLIQFGNGVTIHEKLSALKVLYFNGSIKHMLKSPPRC